MLLKLKSKSSALNAQPSSTASRLKALLAKSTASSNRGPHAHPTSSSSDAADASESSDDDSDNDSDNDSDANDNSAAEGAMAMSEGSNLRRGSSGRAMASNLPSTMQFRSESVSALTRDTPLSVLRRPRGDPLSSLMANAAPVAAASPSASSSQATTTVNQRSTVLFSPTPERDAQLLSLAIADNQASDPVKEKKMPGVCLFVVVVTCVFFFEISYPFYV
jgi:hypothetical protein